MLTFCLTQPNDIATNDEWDREPYTKSYLISDRVMRRIIYREFNFSIDSLPMPCRYMVCVYETQNGVGIYTSSNKHRETEKWRWKKCLNKLIKIKLKHAKNVELHSLRSLKHDANPHRHIYDTRKIQIIHFSFTKSRSKDELERRLN